LARPRKSILRPIVIFLIGIILIAFAFIFWYFTIAPLCTVDTYAVTGQKETKPITNGSSLILYFGTIFYQETDQKNKSRPVDVSLNMELKVETSVEPVNVAIYVRDTLIFTALPSPEAPLICNSSIYNSTSSVTNVFPNVTAAIPVSLLDAFTGGTTPYMIIRNQNANTTASVSYQYLYGSQYRNGRYIPVLFFIIGIIIAVFQGLGLLRYAVRRVRER
jgi:hypothetical protein